MIKKIFLSIVLLCVCLCSFLFNSLSFAQTTTEDICTKVKCVKIEKGLLWVLSSDNKTYVPYFVKAVGYQPTPVGRYPSDWGYAPTDPRSSNNNIYDDPDILNRDFTLLQQMNANTIRVWKGNKTTVSCQCTNNGRFPNYITNASNTANKNTSQNTLDLAASYGLKVIAGFWVNPLTFDSKGNIGSTDDNGNPLTRQNIINNFVSYVKTYRGNRAILFWAIGNENNYQVFNAQTVSQSTFENAFPSQPASYGDAIFQWLQQVGNFVDYDGNIIIDVSSTSIQGILKAQYPNATEYNTILQQLQKAGGTPLSFKQLTAWYSLVNAMAHAAHEAEGPYFHPVAVVNGEIADIGISADGTKDSQMPYLDIWGANIYRGESFGTLFTQYATLSKKPLWISEFGVDAWSVSNATDINDWGSTLAEDLNGTGTYTTTTQSSWDTSLWNEINSNYPVTIGGSVMEYSDEWWKPNEFYCTNPNLSQSANAISAGICNSNQKYFGSPEPIFPDGFLNQEWFGVVSISPSSTVGDPDTVTPRPLYNSLETNWQANPWATITLNVTGSGDGNITSPATFFGKGLDCKFLSDLSSGTCSDDYLPNKTVKLNFSSLKDNSIIGNWGVTGCAVGSKTCEITPGIGINSINVTITAIFKVTATAGSNGKISPSGVQTVDYGANLVFTLTPKSGYTAKLTDNKTAETLTDNTYPLNDITETHKIVASFVKS